MRINTKRCGTEQTPVFLFFSNKFAHLAVNKESRRHVFFYPLTGRREANLLSTFKSNDASLLLSPRSSETDSHEHDDRRDGYAPWVLHGRFDRFHRYLSQHPTVSIMAIRRVLTLHNQTDGVFSCPKLIG